MKKVAHIDASKDVRINPVQLADGRVVSWAEAVPQRQLNFRTTPRD